MSHDIYKGPGPFDVEPVKPVVPGEYTVADQARGFGVPEEQLDPEAPEKTVYLYMGGTVPKAVQESSLYVSTQTDEMGRELFS